jgi:carboxylesterase
MRSWYATAVPPYAHLHPGGFRVGDATSDVGVLMLHGFSGTPTELRELGEMLGQKGMAVHAPLLPGHGLHHRDLEKSTRHEWLAAAAAALDDVAARAKRVVIIGQSMGGLLALHLASQRPGRNPVSAVVALAPALRLRWIAQLTRLPLPLRYLPKYEERLPDLVDKDQVQRVWSNSHTPVRAVPQVLALARETASVLSTVVAPLLVIQGARDKTVVPQGAHQVLALSGSRHKELLWLKDSGHIVAVDGEREQVFSHTAAFLERVV